MGEPTLTTGIVALGRRVLSVAPLVRRRAGPVAGLVALALGIAPAPAGAAITIGTVRSTIVSGPGSNTIDITSVQISGNNRYLLVGLCYGPEDIHTTSTVVLDPGGASQTSLTHLDSATAIFDNDVLCQLWGTTAPPLGTFTVRVTVVNNLVSGYDWIAGAWPLSGVDQTTPRGTVVTNAQDLGNGNATVTVGSAAGEIVFGTAFLEGADGGVQIQAPGVEDWEHFVDDGSGGAHSAGAASVTLDWTAAPDNDDKFAAIAVSMIPARAIAYSVGINTGDLKNGPTTVEVAGGVATFSAPQPDNVGVGDEVLYGAGLQAFISGRVSSTVYTVNTNLGALPTPAPAGTSVTSIKRAFNSLSAAQSGSDDVGFLGSSDLVANDWQLDWACYNDGPDPSDEVLIDEPWVTGPNNYIRVFTPTGPSEVGVSQRHTGVAGTGYRVAPSTVESGGTYNLLEISTDNGHVRIEGIELDGSGVTGADAMYGVQAGDQDGLSDDIRISHSLIHDLVNGNASTTLDVAGINVFSSRPTGNMRISNNIIYDIANIADATAADAMGIRLSAPGPVSTYWVFNNTVFDIRKAGTGGDAHGIEDNGVSRVTARNNYVGKVEHFFGGQQRTFSGAFLLESNNVSSDGRAAGAGSQTGMADYAAYFRDTTLGSEDLHLLNDSVTLWGSSGADLDSDPDLSVTDDIDGEARHATTPDIGADEHFGTAVYRSVGINPLNLNTMGHTATISGTTATFSGVMPNDVGVGDVVTYLSGGARIAFIVARLSPMQFSVWDKDGGMPTPAPALTAAGVYRAYTSLDNWESGTPNPNITEPAPGDVNPSTDLVSAGTVMFVPCYADGEDTGSSDVHIGGWITGPDNYIRIYTPTALSEVGASQRHDGLWDTSAYRISNAVNSNYVINSEAHYIRFDGLQIDLKNDPNNADYFGIRATDDGTDNPVEIRFSNNIVRMTWGTPATDESYGILALDNYTGPNASYVAKLWNNIVYRFLGDSTTAQIRAQDNGTVHVHNNTVIGDNGAASTSRGIDGSVSNLVYVKNNIAIDATDPYNNVVTGPGSGSTHNVSDTGDAPPDGARSCEPTFVNKFGDDFHLASTDPCAKDFGVDLSSDPNLSFLIDIDTAQRQALWDIGADDVAATTEVQLLGFEATPSDSAVDLEWETGSELDNLGFHLYRGLSEDGPWERLTSSVIPGLGSSPLGAHYSWGDTGLANGTRYYYTLEDIDTASVSTFHGPVSAVPRAPDSPPEGEGSGEEEGGEGEGGSGETGGEGAGAGPSGGSGPGAGAGCSPGTETCVETYGDPGSVFVRMLSRGPDHAWVELETGGFHLSRDLEGSVRAAIPGFDDPSDPHAPALPLKRVLLDAVVGKRARVASVQALELSSYPGLEPAAVGHPVMDTRPDGTVRASRRPTSLHRAGEGVLPRDLVRTTGAAFQGEKKKLALEISPLRYDVAEGGLVLARRVRVRVEFAGREASETGTGSLGRRRPRSRPGGGTTIAFLHTSARGLHAAPYETLIPGPSRPWPASALRLQRQGEAVAFHIEPDSALFGPGSVLYFHADSEAPSTAFTGEVAYELVKAGDGVRMGAVSAAPFGDPVGSSSVGQGSFETNRIYRSSLFAGDRWAWQNLVGGTAKTLAFELSGLEPDRPGRLTVFLEGSSDAAGVVDHHVEAYLGPEGERVLLGETHFDGRQPHRLEVEIPPFVLRDGPNELTLENVGDTGVHSLVFVDRFEVEFPQATRLHAGRLAGVWNESGVLEVPIESGSPDVMLGSGHHTGLTRAPASPPSGGRAHRLVQTLSALVAVDVTDPDTPLWLTHLEPGPGSVRLRAEADRRYVLATPDGVRLPRVVSPPRSTLRSSRNQADYVLIAPEAFLAAAEPLLLQRQGQGLTTKAVSLEEITAVFGHGQPSARAIRDFLAFAYHTWRAPTLRYALLLGDASQDPRNFSGQALPAPLPAVTLRTSYLWTASDPTLAAINGEDLLPDIAIGRLPATTLEQAEALVRKILDWEDSGQGLGGPALLVADNPDVGGSFEADLEDIRLSFLAARPTTTLKLSELGGATRPAILDALNQGPSLVSYAGHGGTAIWAGEQVLTSFDADSLLPQSRQPLMLTMNCLNGYFIAPTLDSLAEAFLKVEGRGTIAAFSPSGLSVDGPAHQFHRAVMAEITQGGHERLGDAILAAQVTYAAAGGMPELLSVYHLFGDPALRLR